MQNSEGNNKLTTLTFQYPAHTTKGGYLRMDQAMLDMGLLYNALVKHRQSSTAPTAANSPSAFRTHI